MYSPSGRGGRRRDGLGLNGGLVGDGVDQSRLLPVVAVEEKHLGYEGKTL